MDKILTLILLLSLILNVWGIFPNFYLHQKEPGLLDASDRILINVVQNFDFNPNVPPDPYRYGATTYYFHSLIRGGSIILMYFFHQITGYSFNVPQVFEDHTLKEIYTKDSIFTLQDHLMFVSRLSGALFGILSVYLVYLVSFRLFKKKSLSYFSALSLALMPLFVRDSHYATPDIPQLFLILLAFLFSIKLWENPTQKNYIYVGLIIGLQTSLKHFPLSLLPFLYFHFLVSKWQFFDKNLFISGLAIFLGYFIGQPLIFVHAPEIWKGFTYQLTWYTPDQLVQRSIWQRLFPSYSHFFHFRFALTQAILVMPLLFGLIGFIYGWINYRKIIIGLSLIPLFNTFFITFYLAQIYEYLLIPSLPFLAIMIGLGVWCFFNIFTFSPYKRITLAILIIFVFSASFVKNTKADLACSQQINEYQARTWINNNIPTGTKLAFQPGVMINNAWEETLRSLKEEDFSITELQERNIEYSVLTTGYIDPFTSWQLDFMFPPNYIIKNQFINLVMDQYQKQATLIKSFEKPYMCTGSQIFVYKLPQKLSPAKSEIVGFPLREWKIEDPNHTEVVTSYNDNILTYHYQQGVLNQYRKLEWFYYSSPIFSPYIEAVQEKKYTLSSKIRQESSDRLYPDGYLRLDFYDNQKRKLLTVLTPRVKSRDWENLEVTSVAPLGTKFIRIGFQAITFNKRNTFLIENVRLYSD